jgi:hypothetical protein
MPALRTSSGIHAYCRAVTTGARGKRGNRTSLTMSALSNNFWSRLLHSLIRVFSSASWLSLIGSGTQSRSTPLA